MAGVEEGFVAFIYVGYDSGKPPNVPKLTNARWSSKAMVNSSYTDNSEKQLVSRISWQAYWLQYVATWD